MRRLRPPSRISRKMYTIQPSSDVIREMKNPHPIDRRWTRDSCTVISMAEDRRGIYNTREKFYACAFDKGFGSFRNNTRAIWSARKPGRVLCTASTVTYCQPCWKQLSMRNVGGKERREGTESRDNDRYYVSIDSIVKKVCLSSFLPPSSKRISNGLDEFRGPCGYAVETKE